MPKTTPTVTIVREDGSPARINEADYDKEKHRLYKEPKKAPKEPKKAPKAKKEVILPTDVKETDGKFYLVDGAGEVVLGTAVYENSADAWNAIAALKQS